MSLRGRVVALPPHVSYFEQYFPKYRFATEICKMSNAGATSAVQHPLQATASAIAGAGADPRPNRTSLFQSANEGPAEIAAKISGVTLGGKREDDATYFTNNEGIPWPDPYVL